MKGTLRRVCGLLLTLSLLAGLGILPAMAVDTPKIGVAVRAVTENGALTGELEVSLTLTMTLAAGEEARSVSGILQYDTSKLTMKRWNRAELITPTATTQAGSTMASGEVVGKYSSVFQPTTGTWAYVYFSAQAADTLKTGKPLVSLKFVKTGGVSDLTQAWLTDALKPVGTMSSELNTAFPAAVAPFTAHIMKNSTSYRYSSDAASGSYLSLTAPTSVEALTSGESQYGGKVSEEDYHSVVFYDWDGTLLGARAVLDGDSLREEIVPEPSTKGGYAFAGWVDYATGNSVPDVALSAAAGQRIPAENLVATDKVTNNLTLKAAYHEKVGQLGATATARQYNKVTYTAFQEKNGALETTITVTRPAAARRAENGKIFLSVTLQPNIGGATTVQIPLGASDTETATFTMPKGANDNYKELRLAVVDAKGERSEPVYVSASEIVG